MLVDEHLGDMLCLIPEMRMFVGLLRAFFESPEAYQRKLELQKAQREVKKKQEAEKNKEN